jgi:hypothetical protein
MGAPDADSQGALILREAETRCVGFWRSSQDGEDGGDEQMFGAK